LPSFSINSLSRFLWLGEVDTITFQPVVTYFICKHSVENPLKLGAGHEFKFLGKPILLIYIDFGLNSKTELTLRQA